MVITREAAEKAVLTTLKEQTPEIKDDVKTAIADYRKIRSVFASLMPIPLYLEHVRNP